MNESFSKKLAFQINPLFILKLKNEYDSNITVKLSKRNIFITLISLILSFWI